MRVTIGRGSKSVSVTVLTGSDVKWTHRRKNADDLLNFLGINRETN